MDIEKYNQLSNNISELVEQFRNKHKQSYYVSFSYGFYAVADNDVIASPQKGVLRDCQWGYVWFSYFSGEFGLNRYPKSTERGFFVSPDGYVCESLSLGNIIVSKWYGHLKINTLDGNPLYYTKEEKTQEAMREILPYIPLLQGCRSEEEAKMLIEIKANHQEKNSREEMVDVLMEEIKRLKDKVNEYEKIFDEIRARIPQGKS